MIASKLRMDRAIRRGLLLMCLLILPAALPGSGQAGQPAQTAQADNKRSIEPGDVLRTLQLERYNVLKETVAQLQAMAEKGREDTANLRDLTVAMFHAEADLADSAAARVKVYERLAEFASGYQGHVERMAAAGRASPLDVSKARVFALDVQIEIEKQRLAQRVAK